MSEYRLHRERRKGIVSWRRALALSASAVAGFLVTCLAIHSLTSHAQAPPDLSLATTKPRLLRDQAAEVDTLFVGTSRVYRSVDPEVFDTVAAAGGRATRSFNLGIGGLSALELRDVLREVDAVGLPRLERVFIEPTLRVLPNRINLQSARVVLAFDLETTLDGLRLSLDRPQTVRRRFSAAGLLGLAFLQNLANRGLLASLLLAPCPDCEAALPLLERQRGYRALEDESVEFTAGRRAEFETELAAWGGSWPPTTRHKGRPASDAELEFWGEIVALVRSMGATPLFLLPPQTLRSTQPRMLHEDLAAAFPKVDFLAYYQGAGPEEFFRQENWFDRGHLKRAAARRFTRRLARDWLALARRD